jgi:hypothetical protein
MKKTMMVDSTPSDLESSEFSAGVPNPESLQIYTVHTLY